MLEQIERIIEITGQGVIPTKLDKAPACKNGVHDATKDLSKIETWFDSDLVHGYGVACGGGLIVVDVDGPKGLDTLNKLEPLPLTYTVRTPSGGVHLYFRGPPNLKNRVGLFPNIDIRGLGGYVVGPGSVSYSKSAQASGVYKAEIEMELADLPDWLLDKLDTTEKERNFVWPPDPAKRAREVLSKAVGSLTACAEGQRNDTLNTEAFKLAPYVQYGFLSREKVVDMLSTNAEMIGMGADEIQKTIASGLSSKGFPPPPEGGRSSLTLPPDWTYQDCAELFLSVTPQTVVWFEEFYCRDGQKFVPVKEKEIDALIQKLFADVGIMQVDKEGRLTGKTKKFKPDSGKVRHIRAAVYAEVPRFEGQLPINLRTGEHEPELVQLTDAVLNVRGRGVDADTELFTTHALPISGAHVFEESSTPVFDAFLDDIFEEAPNSRECLLQFIGSILARDTSRHKALQLIGPSRAGKGLILSIIHKLVGPDACAGTSLNLLASDFGLSSLLGKSVAIMSDERFVGRSEQQARAVGALLNLTAGDLVPVNRKGKSVVHVRMPMHIVLASNELPRLQDASAVIAQRMLIIQLTKSYLGREQLDLGARLLDEAPGIFTKCLDAYRVLGHDFTRPEGQAEALRTMRAIANPLTEYLSSCEPDPNAEILFTELVNDYWAFCSARGIDHPGNHFTIKQRLAALEHSSDIPFRLVREDDGGRLCVYGLKRPTSLNEAC